MDDDWGYTYDLGNPHISTIDNHGWIISAVCSKCCLVLTIVESSVQPFKKMLSWNSLSCLVMFLRHPLRLVHPWSMVHGKKWWMDWNIDFIGTKALWHGHVTTWLVAAWLVHIPYVFSGQPILEDSAIFVVYMIVCVYIYILLYSCIYTIINSIYSIIGYSIFHSIQ